MTTKAEKLAPVSIRLEADVKAALEGIARAEDRSLSYVINRALREHVEEARKRKSARSRA